MPDTIQYEPCTVDSICRGPAFWKPDRKLVSEVYALAKAQALQLGIAGDRQIKWAVLRAQAFSAGWYHGQKYSRLCSPPKNSAEIYANDLGAIKKYLSDAWKLVCFLPFVHELAFRKRLGAHGHGILTMQLNMKAEQGSLLILHRLVLLYLTWQVKISMVLLCNGLVWRCL